MGRHVVGPLGGVPETGVTIRYQVAHEGLQVFEYGRIGILIDHQRRARMANEQMAQPVRDTTAFDDRRDTRREFEAAATSSLDD